MKEDIARLEGQIEAHRQETREDFARVDKRLAHVDERLAQTATRQELKTGLAEVRSEMHAGFAEVRSEMHTDLAELRSAFEALNRTLLISAGGIIAALIGVLGAALFA